MCGGVELNAGTEEDIVSNRDFGAVEDYLWADESKPVLGSRYNTVQKKGEATENK